MSVPSMIVDKATRNNEVPKVITVSISKPSRVQFDFGREVAREKWECCKCSTANDLGIENDFNGKLLPEWCRYASCWHNRCEWCYYVGNSSRRRCNGTVSRKLRYKEGDEETDTFPLKPDSVVVRMPTISDAINPFHQSEKATVEVSEQNSTVNIQIETRLSSETRTTPNETTKSGKDMSPRRPARPKGSPKNQATDGRSEGALRFQKKKKQQPSSENVFVLLAKSAFPDIPSKSRAKSVIFDKNCKPEAETKPRTEGEQAFEKILLALEKIKEREEAGKKDKGKDRA